MLVKKKEIAKQLQAEIDALQGLGKTYSYAQQGFAPFSSAFPGNVFPLGTLHEFSSYTPDAAASTNGFITALTGKLMKGNGLCLWIGREKKVFAPALKQFGIEPDRIIFVHTSKLKDALWTVEEALKCEAFTAVIGEMPQLGFSESRRLQLAVERSGVTGFLHRNAPLTENSVACTARWKVSPLPSEATGNLPGLGQSCWRVQLVKVRNGKPHSWEIVWSANQFRQLKAKQALRPSFIEKQVG